MIPNDRAEDGSGKMGALLALTFVALAVLIVFFAGSLRRYIRESLMQSVTSAHYRILWPPGEMPADAVRQFVLQRESLFVALDRKLNDAASNVEIRVIFDPEFRAAHSTADAAQPYEVTGTTIRTKLSGVFPQLDTAADAEALLYAAWGKPGNALIARWTVRWLVGKWQGEELGMAAAAVEQRLGHRKVASLLGQPSDGVLLPQDRELLEAAWVNAIAELGGTANVQKLYLERMDKPDIAEVTKVLGTNPTELERKWQMWMYAYIAGMPPASHTMKMPMDMPMSK